MPSHSCDMAKLLIQRCRVHIINNLGDVSSVLDHLESDEIISRHESEKIKVNATSKEKARELLNVLYDKAANKKGIQCFKNALLAEKYESIVEHINDEELKLRTSDDSFANDANYCRDSSEDISLVKAKLIKYNTNANNATSQIKGALKRYPFIRESAQCKNECTGQCKRNNDYQKAIIQTAEIKKGIQMQANYSNTITHGFLSITPMTTNGNQEISRVEKELSETAVDLTHLADQSLSHSLNQEENKAQKLFHGSPSCPESIHIGQTDVRREVSTSFLREHINSEQVNLQPSDNIFANDDYYHKDSRPINLLKLTKRNKIEDVLKRYPFIRGRTQYTRERTGQPRRNNDYQKTKLDVMRTPKIGKRIEIKANFNTEITPRSISPTWAERNQKTLLVERKQRETAVGLASISNDEITPRSISPTWAERNQKTLLVERKQRETAVGLASISNDEITPRSISPTWAERNQKTLLVERKQRETAVGLASISNDEITPRSISPTWAERNQKTLLVERKQRETAVGLASISNDEITPRSISPTWAERNQKTLLVERKQRETAVGLASISNDEITPRSISPTWAERNQKTLLVERKQRETAVGLASISNDKMTPMSISPTWAERNQKSLLAEKKKSDTAAVGLASITKQRSSGSLNRNKPKVRKLLHKTQSYDDAIKTTDARRELSDPFLRQESRKSFQRGLQMFEDKEADTDDRYKEETVSMLTQVPLNNTFTHDKMKNQNAHGNDKKTRLDSSMPAVIVSDIPRNLSTKEVIESKIASSVSLNNLSTDGRPTINCNKQFTSDNDGQVRLVSPISTIDLSRLHGDARTNYNIQQAYTNDGKPWNINSTTKYTHGKPDDVTARLVSPGDPGGPSSLVSPVSKTSLSKGDTKMNDDLPYRPRSSHDEISKLISPISRININLKQDLQRPVTLKECDNKKTEPREYQRNDLHTDKFYTVTIDNQSKQELPNIPNSLNKSCNVTFKPPKDTVNNYYVISRLEECFCSTIRLSNPKDSVTARKRVFI